MPLCLGENAQDELASDPTAQGLAHQTGDKTLSQCAKRLVGAEVGPGGATLRGIEAAGFGFRPTLRNFLGNPFL